MLITNQIFNVKQFSDRGYNSSRSPPLLYINCYSSLPSLCEASHKDGFGEGFEQREIKIDDGYICVSFWNGSDDYFMENQDDFENRMSDDQNMGMQMGGM